MRRVGCLHLFCVALVCLSISLVKAEDPYRYYTWTVTYGTIAPLGVPQQVTGKPVMLDEIINYVQSLQRQVEFLSMKLATINPRLYLNMETLLSKDILRSRGPLPNTMYPFDSSAATCSYGHQPQQGPLTSIVSNGSDTQCSVNPLDATLRRALSMQMPTIALSPSAEGGEEDEGVDDQAVKVVDIVDTFRLQVSKTRPNLFIGAVTLYTTLYLSTMTRLKGELLGMEARASINAYCLDIGRKETIRLNFKETSH